MAKEQSQMKPGIYKLPKVYTAITGVGHRLKITNSK